jgi:hypothetical protein
MKYQLVLQWPYSSGADYNRLISLEQTIRDGLGDLGIVDGHDYGSGEMNIFIHTDEPAMAFEKAKMLLDPGKDFGHMKAGYRDFEQDEYIAIFPQGTKDFSVA